MNGLFPSPATAKPGGPAQGLPAGPAPGAPALAGFHRTTAPLREGVDPKPAKAGAPGAAGFTLIELILVMAILTMAVSVTAPALSNFFRGRTLVSEAQRMLALTHGGQTRAVTEGVPMDFWVDPAQGRFGLEAEPSYETSDARKVEFQLDSGLRIQVLANQTGAPPPATPALSQGLAPSTASVTKVLLTHPGLATIRFLPDGTISDTSPQKLRLMGRDGDSLWLVLARNRLSYEIRNADK